MSDEVFPLESSKYQLHKLIGRGATATVYAAKCLTNDIEVAIKLIDLEQCPIEIETLRAEVAFWSSCDHPNLVKYYGSFIEKSTLYIIMEYMDEGSIYEIIRFGFHHGIPKENFISAIIRDVLRALAYFHENRQIHRDVKAGNILVNKKGQIKLADFGIAAKLIEKGQRVRARFTVIGTPCYMAPEVLCAGIGYTEKADIWSLGITAIELATGSAPYSNLYPLEVIVRVSNSPPPTLADTFSSSFRDFVKCALQPDPSRRPTANELLNHWFIKQSANDKDLCELFGAIPSIQDQYELIHQQRSSSKKNSNKNGDEELECDEQLQQQQQINQKVEKKTEWNFLDQVETNPEKVTTNPPEKRMIKSSSCSSEEDYYYTNEIVDENEIVQKGKFKITKRSLQNLPKEDAIVGLMKNKILGMKKRIDQLKIQNRSINKQLDSLFGELSELVI